MSDKNMGGVWTDSAVRKLLDENSELRAWGWRAYELIKELVDVGLLELETDTQLVDSAPKVIKEGAKQG